MGFLQRRKAPASAPAAAVARARANRPVAHGSSAASVPILNPTSDVELERVLNSAGPARGVVIAAHHDMVPGDRPVRTRVHLTVRPRLKGGLGDEAELTAWVGWKAAALLEPGLEIPVQLNRSSGRIDAIATDLLARELVSRDDDAKRRWPEACSFLPPTGVPQPGPDH